jgi:hypothetical protein
MESKNTFFAFEFRLSNSNERKLIISPYSLQEFHDILMKNNTFSSQFNKWIRFRIIYGIEYKKSLRNEVENSTNHLLAKLINMAI